jgi:hypothetical protein
MEEPLIDPEEKKLMGDPSTESKTPGAVSADRYDGVG